MKIRKLVILSLLVSLALAISLVEQYIPLPIGVPGAKLGISNMVILTTLVIFGFREMLVVAALKSVLLLLITGSVTGFWYSFSGAVVSSVVMGIGKKCLMPPFSLVGISELGAFGHNVGQISIACIIFSNYKLYYYLPVLTLFGVFTGYFVGLSTEYITKHLNRVDYVGKEIRNNGKDYN